MSQEIDLGVYIEEFTHSLLQKYVNKVLQKRHLEYLDPIPGDIYKEGARLSFFCRTET